MFYSLLRKVGRKYVEDTRKHCGKNQSLVAKSGETFGDACSIHFKVPLAKECRGKGQTNNKSKSYCK